MFMQNVSKATERKAPQTNKVEKEIATTEIVEEEAAKEIMYSADLNNGDLPRDVLMTFLVQCSEAMSIDTNILQIVVKSRRLNKPLHVLGVEFQREHMAKRHGIEANFGCKLLGSIPVDYPDDNELIESAQNFVFSSIKFFLDAVDLRGKSFKGKFKTYGMMPLDTVHEFFEACNATMILPETKKALKEIFDETQKPPNQAVIEYQHSILQKLGYTIDFGVQCLNNLSRDYGPTDRSLPMRFQQFSLSAQLAVQESMMSDEEKKTFYENIPPLMKYTPHAYVLMERQKKMQEQYAQQQQQSSSQAQDIAKILSSSEGREKFQKLKTKMDKIRNEVLIDVKTWDIDRKKEFIGNFNDLDIIDTMTADSNIAARMYKMIDMSEKDLHSLMTFETLAKEDAETDGSLGLKAMYSQNGATDGSEDKGGVMNKLSGLLQTFGGGGGGGPAPGMGHGHQHHGHQQHGSNCDSCCPPQKTVADVSSGISNKMER